MAITGPSRQEAVRGFCDILNRLINTTLTERRLVVAEVGSQLVVSFRRGKGANSRVDPVTLQVAGRGVYHVTFTQHCDTYETERGHAVATVSYRYALWLPGADPHIAEPALRWEYERTRQENKGLWCRHHLQGAAPINLGQGDMSMNDYHLPTGFVTLEEVIRFLIVDLGVRALSDNWDTVLDESYRRFKSDYTPPH